MKKLIALLMVCGFAFAFVACGGAKKSESAQDSTAAAPDTTAAPAADTTVKADSTAK